MTYNTSSTSSLFYDKFHVKNKNFQQKLISKNNFTYQYLLEVITKYFRQKSNVLDIGCGVGAIDLYLASLGNDVLGIDVSKKAISAANYTAHFHEFNNVKFINQDVEKLELRNMTFRFILCCEVMEHIRNDKKLLIRIKSLLKPNGICVLSVPSINAPLYKLGLLKDFDKTVGHLRRYSPEDIKDKVEEVGFKIIEMQKNEGLFRNSIYTFKGLGFIVKFIRGPFIPVFNFLDYISLKLFGESDLLLILSR